MSVFGATDAVFDAGMGNEVLRDFMENGMGSSTPEQAAEAQSEVFASR